MPGNCLPVEVHAYADRIVIRQDGEVVAEHRRVSVASRLFTIPGIMCRSWRASRERCATALPLKNWLLRGAPRCSKPEPRPKPISSSRLGFVHVKGVPGMRKSLAELATRTLGVPGFAIRCHRAHRSRGTGGSNPVSSAGASINRFDRQGYRRALLHLRGGDRSRRLYSTRWRRPGHLDGSWARPLRPRAPTSTP
jgi:hypothetical protein